ncbi:MAG TPA: TetR family transcriptional regulator [Acidimicrobiales bacterium]|nr:TetR family transcriptional regulator [Acidimicrobiales bacterium]
MALLDTSQPRTPSPEAGPEAEAQRQSPPEPEPDVEPAGTPGRILQAAIDEFAQFGLAGARVDRIAERAGANKALLYRYFGSKEALFDAAIQTMASRFDQIRSALPASLEGRLPYYFERATDDQQWVRMLQWEALQTGAGPTVNEDQRREHMQKAVEGVKADQAAGLLPADLDAGQLFLTFQALSAHPSAFPQMTRFITGMNPTDPEFRAQRAEFLRGLARHLVPQPPPGETGSLADDRP